MNHAMDVDSTDTVRSCVLLDVKMSQFNAKYARMNEPSSIHSLTLLNLLPRAPQYPFEYTSFSFVYTGRLRVFAVRSTGILEK